MTRQLGLVCSLATLWACGDSPPPRAPTLADNPPAAPEPTAAATAPERAPAGFAPLPPEVVSLADAPPQPAVDLPALRRIGVLRVLVQQAFADAAPPAGSPIARDRAALETWAATLGLQIRYVLVPAPAPTGLVSALREGHGDLIGDLLPVSAALELSFTKPLRLVDTVVAVPKKQKVGAAQLPKQTYLARPDDEARLRALISPTVRLSPVAPQLDDEAVLAEVGDGKGLALVSSDVLDAYLSYEDDVARGPILERAVPAAWAVRAGARELLAALNSFVYERELLGHRQQSLGGDLDAIKKRKVLRVGMLNNAASYFVYRGQEVGFQYELAQLLASRLGVRLEVVVPDKPADLPKLLLERRADVVALATGETTPEGVRLTAPFSWAKQVLVQRTADRPLTSLAELAGRAVHVRASSAYYPTLAALRQKIPDLGIAPVSEELETEEILDLVAKGKLPLTVCNSSLLDVELTYRDDLRGTLVLAEKQGLAYAVRSDAKALFERLARFVEEEPGKAPFQAMTTRYFKDPRKMRELRAEDTAASGRISPYDDIVRRVAEAHGIDWRLILAQMYQESRFDPRAKSWAGAQGLLQLMPRTGRELGVTNLWEPEANIQAGVGYLAKLLERFEAHIPMRQRVRFALASYNAGFEHVRDARLLARKRGLDPDRWFGQVEEAMLLLEKPKFSRRARFGFCRGREPVAYVSRIQTKYEGYAAVMPSYGPAEQ